MRGINITRSVFLSNDCEGDRLLNKNTRCSDNLFILSCVRHSPGTGLSYFLP